MEEGEVSKGPEAQSSATRERSLLSPISGLSEHTGSLHRVPESAKFKVLAINRVIPMASPIIYFVSLLSFTQPLGATIWSAIWRRRLHKVLNLHQRKLKSQRS